MNRSCQPETAHQTQSGDHASLTIILELSCQRRPGKGSGFSIQKDIEVLLIILQYLETDLSPFEEVSVQLAFHVRGSDENS
ncbi:uncharacterized protein LOC132558149 isoform X2 [Ylistrum balloti]|uniref:uncharacterized protein LOC132558149 isoform X2 n=1 Tax=Ylistrum balloti TaxID=509963 RepID=UPI002905CD4A|nr:uncharacterized protein LOC132558149 isoform X2 [Ylistrum balloti]